jgi:outer membrane usher protein
VFHDSNRAIDNIKISSQIEDSKYVKSGEVDLVYSSKYSEFGIRENVIKSKYSRNQFQTNLRALSALSFVYDDKIRFGLSRPVSNSFAIISGNDLLKDEKIGLKTSGHRVVENKGLFNEIVVRDLIPYQYRRLQVDPSQLKEGYTLNQESFIVYPKYKAGHLLKLEAIGTVSLKGRIINKVKSPQSLSVGDVLLSNGKKLPFFTNKQGFFYIEGLNFGSVKILWGDESKPIKDVTIPEGQSGILDIGEVSID